MTAESPRQRRSSARDGRRADGGPAPRAAPVVASAAAHPPVPVWRKLLGLDESDSPEDEEERRKYRRIGALGGVGFVLGGTVLAGLEFGPPAVVLILAALTLVAVIATLWHSVRTLLGETKLSAADAFAIGAPRAEEEQKRAVLRAMKDLEFERTVGKISEEDYAVLVTRFRAEAKRLLREIDQATAEQRARAEEVVRARLESVGLTALPEEPIVAPPAAVPAFEPIPEEAEAPAAAEPQLPADPKPEEDASSEMETEKKETAGDA
jgi:hypothetical protein